MSTRAIRLGSLFVVLAASSAACGGGEPSPVAPPSVPTSTPAPAVTATAAAPPLAPATSDPTALTDAEQARDKILAPKIGAIIDAFGSYDARLAPDGKKFLFRSNRGGVSEVYLADVGKPADPVKKIVPGPERVVAADFTRDGKFVVFKRDTGADENYRLYRVKLDGSELTELTTGEAMHRDDAHLPRKKPNALIFTARRKTSPETMLYVGSIATPGDAKVVYTDPTPLFASSVSDDGGHALLVRFVSPTDQIVFDVDIAAGKSKRVYPPEGKAAGVSGVDYSADGKRIFLATNAGGEENVLLTLDATTYAEKGRYVQDRPKSAGIYEMLVSPKGDRLAISVDAGNKNDLRILDAQTLKVTMEVKLPLGATSLSKFSEDGKRFTITQSLPDQPPDPYLVNVQTGTLEALRDDKRPGLGDLPGLETTVTTIPAHDGLTIPLHYYLPKGRDLTKRMPVIVHFHGGPAGSSRVAWNWMARSFTSQGFAFVEPNIRGSTGFGRAYEMADNREKRADAIKDLATVNTWLRNQAWADPDRLVIYGGSYGGYLVLMGLTRQSDIWRAGVDFVGVANLFTFLKSTDQTIRVAFADEFGDLDKDQKLLEQFSPMRDKDKIVMPLFVYQGQNDPRVPRPESDQVVASLRSRRIPVEYMVAPDEGHSLDRRENKVQFATRVSRFLSEHLAAPRPK